MRNQKYEITDIAHEKYLFLHRIRALRDIGSEVKAGDLGGFVEHEGNLSYSSLARIRAFAPVSFSIWVSSSRGVLPIS